MSGEKRGVIETTDDNHLGSTSVVGGGVRKSKQAKVEARKETQDGAATEEFLATLNAPTDKDFGGFYNLTSSEALPGALPRRQNLPQKNPYGLYQEQLNGTTFTTPRAQNRNLWMYRIRPTPTHTSFKEVSKEHENLNYVSDYVGGDQYVKLPPSLAKWRPLPLPEAPTDFHKGIFSLVGNGSPHEGRGFAIHLYACNRSMERSLMVNSDGSYLFVPQEGDLRIQTELGWLTCAPGEVVIIPQGIKFSVKLVHSTARGYLLEIFQRHFVLPELGVIGANGLANPRHFLPPNASYENLDVEHTYLQRFDGVTYQAKYPHSPFDVVAWYGNHVPVKYDLTLFCALGTLTVDHMDPSLLCVLTVPSETPGRALVDFILFPPRWNVAEHTFRPVFFHRNAATEFNGIIKNDNNKPHDDGDDFEPGCSFLTPYLIGHGITDSSVREGREARLQPKAPNRDSLWFMFESGFSVRVAKPAAHSPLLDVDKWPQRSYNVTKYFQEGNPEPC